MIPEVQAGVSTQSAQMMLETPLSPQASLMFGARRAYADGLLGGLQVPGRLSLQGSAYYDLTTKLTVRPKVGHEFRLSAYRAGDRLPAERWEIRLEFAADPARRRITATSLGCAPPIPPFPDPPAD